MERIASLIVSTALLASIILGGCDASGEIHSRKWNAIREKELRQLIADESITIELFKPEGAFPLPLQRLCVPVRFVEIYQLSPVECLTVLANIVDKGNPHDAIVAFQFGMAGDEPQGGLPLFHYLSEEDLEKPFANGPSYRETCLRILRDQLGDVTKAARSQP